jgi:ParB family chromosome partitioning protein
MRHEPHFVEELMTRHEVAVGKMAPLSAIEPNPAQPRRDLGDLSDLVASIRDKGVLEPILVTRLDPPQGAKLYRVVSGERRYRAALSAGLFEVPLIELDVSEQEALEIALIENLQRKDLTPFEEADGLAVLVSQHGYRHEDLAAALGRSRTSVTEILALHEIPLEVRQALPLGLGKSVLLEISRIKRRDDLEEFLIGLAATGTAPSRDDLRAARSKRTAGKAPRRKAFVFKFRAPDRTYSMAVQFRQPTVERVDLIRALEAVLADLRAAQQQEGQR